MAGKKSSNISVFLASFVISFGAIATIIGLLDALEFSYLKTIGVIPGIIIVLESCIVFACLRIIIRSNTNEPEVNPDFIETFKKNGLVNAFRIKEQNRQREDRIIQLVDNECKRSGTRQFRLVASSGFNYLHFMGYVWLHGLKDAVVNNKIEFKVILESPFSSHAIARALACKSDTHHWIEKVDIPTLKKRIQKFKNFEIRVTSHPVNCSLFFTSESVFYDPYLWALPEEGEGVENNFWVFDFNKIPDWEKSSSGCGCYDLLEMHFNFLFEHSIPLNEFLGVNDENYNKQTKEFKDKINELKMKRF